ncbi:hypothetical protein [uncultured Ruminococcus sp.]|uniref:hypothetical protein n=1 Tax=uncultured Ruminococcus sp. TaxID=165186 RepID=UPI002665C0C7|nr:hypothetical protein [uncultured Ruminococcus sp.]
MSKKDRLKAQKEKQDRLKKEAELEEQREREEAREKQSRSAKKMMKKAKRVKPNGEPVYYLILKLIMIVPFAYSGFFYGGVTIVGIIGKYIEPVPPKWVLWAMAAGIVAMFAGILFAFFKKYIVSFVLSVGGTVSFLKAGGYLIKRIQDKLSTTAVDQSLQNMDKEYMWRFYPIIGVAVISTVLLICTVIRKLMERKRFQRERDNAPVESIID